MIADIFLYDHRFLFPRLKSSLKRLDPFILIFKKINKTSNLDGIQSGKSLSGTNIQECLSPKLLHGIRIMMGMPHVLLDQQSPIAFLDLRCAILSRKI